MHKKHRLPLLILLVVFLIQPLASFQVVAEMLTDETGLTLPLEPSEVEASSTSIPLPSTVPVEETGEAVLTDELIEELTGEASTTTPLVDTEPSTEISDAGESATESSETSDSPISDTSVKTSGLPSESQTEITNETTEEIVERSTAGMVPMQAEVFTYEEIIGGVRITGFADGISLQDVVIPDEINGLPVTEIGAYAFFQEQIAQLTLGANVRVIGDYAFASNQLSSVVWTALPESQWNLAPKLQIGEQAFRDN